MQVNKAVRQLGNPQSSRLQIVWCLDAVQLYSQVSAMVLYLNEGHDHHNDKEQLRNRVSILNIRLHASLETPGSWDDQKEDYKDTSQGDPLDSVK